MLVARIHHNHHRWNDNDWDDDDYGYGEERYYRRRGLLGGVVGLLDDLL